MRDANTILIKELKGRIRRLDAHHRCCLQGYAAKITLSKQPHSNHTTAGIPQQYLEEGRA